MGQTALLPFRRKACWGFFFALKNPTDSAGFEPANWGTKGQHATSKTTEAASSCCNISSTFFMLLRLEHLNEQKLRMRVSFYVSRTTHCTLSVLATDIQSFETSFCFSVWEEFSAYLATNLELIRTSFVSLNADLTESTVGLSHAGEIQAVRKC